MLLDIVILPPDNIRRQLSIVAKKINKAYPSPCIVDNVALIPHISLYHFSINKRDLLTAFDTVKQVISNTNKFLVVSGKVHIGSISIEVEIKSAGIFNLNKKILKHCSPLRTGIMPDTFKRNLTSTVKKAIANYGTVGTVINYRPHVTLLVNMKGFADKDSQINFRPKFHFKSSVVAVCQINRYYQVTKVLKKFRV